MKRVLTSTLVSLALVASGTAGAALATRDAGPVKDAQTRPTRADGVAAPDTVKTENGVTRVYGLDRYATAAAIADFYGWTSDNAGVVYIATGDNYPDALALGPSTFDLGPMLLVKKDSIPPATRAKLGELMPCYIDVMGSSTTISDTVFKELQSYTHPELCGG